MSVDPSDPPPYAAVVLSGGAGRRMGGPDKPMRTVAGVPMRDRVLAAVADAAVRVLVGPAIQVPAGVRVAREEPLGAGPLPAAAAGLAVLGCPRPPVALLLAADLPLLTPAAVRQLRAVLAADPRADAAAYRDAAGVRQYLCAAWRTAALAEAVAGAATPAVRGLYGGRRVADLAAGPAGLPGSPGALAPWFDCDTEEELRRAEAAARPDAGGWR